MVGYLGIINYTHNLHMESPLPNIFSIILRTTSTVYTDSLSPVHLAYLQFECFAYLRPYLLTRVHGTHSTAAIVIVQRSQEGASPQFGRTNQHEMHYRGAYHA